MGKNTTMLRVKISLDIIMAVLLLMLYQKRTISMSFHEIAGLVLFGLFLIHNLLNRSWIKAVTLKLFQKSTSLKLRISWIINVLLFLSMTGIIVTGIMISKTLPIHVGRWFGAQQWHYFLAAISIILMGIHLGLHWSFMKGIMSRVSFLQKKISIIVGVGVLVVALTWGSYSLFTGSFVRWVTGPFTEQSFQKGDQAGEFQGDFQGEFKGEMKEKIQGDPQGEVPDRENNGEQNGQRMAPREGNDMNQSISIIRILSTIATYGSEMIVFAFFTVLAFGFRKL